VPAGSLSANITPTEFPNEPLLYFLLEHSRDEAKGDYKNHRGYIGIGFPTPLFWFSLIKISKYIVDDPSSKIYKS